MKLNPIIILEGQDRCGKSTLANQLANYYGPGAIKHHSSSPPKGLVYPDAKIWEDNNYYSLMNTFSDVSKTNAVICDRFHLGQVIYGKRYRGYPDSMHVTDLEKLMYIRDNVFLILVLDDAHELIKRDDGNSFEKSQEDFNETASQFTTEFDLSLIQNKFSVNISDIGGFGKLYDTILDYIEGVRLCKK